MRYLTAFLLVGFLSSYPDSARAEILSGNELKKTCDASDSTFQDGFCFGYVAGVFENVKSKICFPIGVSHSQAVLVVKKYLQDHPERLHQDASGLIVAPLQMAFPCAR